MVTKKILHLPKVTAGFATNLAQMENRNGYSSQVVNYHTNPYGYASDMDFLGAGRYGRFLSKCRYFLQNYNEYATVHFNNGESLLHSSKPYLQLLDMPYWQAEQKVMTFTGSDARLTIPEDVYRSLEEELKGPRAKLTDATRYHLNDVKIVKKQKIIEKTAKYCGQIFTLNPDTIAFLPDNVKLAPYPLPFSFEKPDSKRFHSTEPRPLRIAHTASDPVFKGTSFVESAFERAKSELPELETRILIRAPRSEVIETFKWADVVVDQLCLGWFGTQAIEAMAHHCLVMCNIAYDAPPDWPLLPALDSIVRVDIDNLASKICELAVNRDIVDQNIFKMRQRLIKIRDVDVVAFYH